MNNHILRIRNLREIKQKLKCYKRKEGSQKPYHPSLNCNIVNSALQSSMCSTRETRRMPKESDQEEYDITFPDHLLDNARRLQINVTNSQKGFLPPPYDENEEEERGTWILLSAGIGWIILASSIGYIIVSKYNCVTEEDLDD